MRDIDVNKVLNKIANNSPYYQYKYDNGESENRDFLTGKQSRYALLLGAGASVDSEIPSSSELIKYFASAICKIDCPKIFDNDEDRLEWLRKKGYYNNDEDMYRSLFEKCFDKKYERRDFIERQTEGKIPSPGYIALAHLLKKQTFDTVITTNFDDLVNMACTHFTDIRPAVFSLGGFASEIASVINRPRVLKIHGDYLFSDLKTTKEELKNQDPNMEQQVKEILNSYRGLIVLGHDGNDKSVIDILEHFPDDKENSLFWCVYKDEKINERVEKLLNSKEGAYIVRIDGFDSFMLNLAGIEGIRSADIVKSLSKRNEDIISKFTKLNFDKSDSEYQYEEKTIIREHKKIQDALTVMELLLSGNKYFEDKEYEKAEEFYEKAKDLRENEADAHYNYAKVVSIDLKRADLAALHFEKAVELNPDDAYARNRHANMLVRLEKFDEAEVLYELAAQLNQNYVHPIIGLGDLNLEKDNLDEAEEWYLKAQNMEAAARTSKLALAEIYYKISRLLKKQGEPDKAEEKLREGLNPEIGLLEYLIGEETHYLRTNDEDNAGKINEEIKNIKESFRTDIEQYYGEY